MGGLLLALTPAWGSENLKTGRNLWVDANALRQGNGSREQPFKTIQAAADISTPGTTIHVLPGVYRERVMPQRSGEPGRPIVYKSEVLHGAVVTGSDVWHPQWRNEKNGIYSGELKESLFTDNHYNDGGNPYRISYYWEQTKNHLPPSPFAHVEWTLGQVFVDGKPLGESSSRKELDNVSQSWWFDGVGNCIYVNLGGQNPRNHHIEITTRRGVFRPQKKGLGYIEVFGFVFEHCANQFPGEFWTISQNAQSGMVGTRGGNHWVIANNIIRYAKSIGLTLGTSGGRGRYDNEVPAQQDPIDSEVGFDRIENNVFAFNGAVGVMGFGDHNVLICSNLFLGNNTLLNTGYETGGIKTHQAFGIQIEHNWFINNDCEGVWLDNTWENCVIARNIFLGNRGKNIFFEMGHNNAATSCRVVCNVFLPGRPALRVADRHNLQLGQISSAGIYGHDVSGIHISHNLFVGEDYGLYFRKLTDRKGGCGDLRAMYNMFIGNRINPVCLPFPHPPQVQGNFFDANVYPVRPRPMVATGWSLPEGSTDSPSVQKIFNLANCVGGGIEVFGRSRSSPDGYYLSLDQWRSVMGFDSHSFEANIYSSFNSNSWCLTLVVPGSVPHGTQLPAEEGETDFFGQPFLHGGMVGPIAKLSVGTNWIKLPSPPDDL